MLTALFANTRVQNIEIGDFDEEKIRETDSCQAGGFICRDGKENLVAQISNLTIVDLGPRL